MPKIRHPKKASQPPKTIADLITLCGGHVTIACDTEFYGPHTLTIQFAARLGNDIVVQVYSSTAIPEQPTVPMLKSLLPREIVTAGQRVIIREGRRIPEDLSPARVLADLFDFKGVEALDRVGEEGSEMVGEEGDGGCKPDGALTLTLVGHFWRADFFRIFGRRFFDVLRDYPIKTGELVVQERRLLSFREPRGAHSGEPVLGYACQRGELYAIKVNHFDTCLAFGNRASLDDLAKTFVGVGKLEGFGNAEKADMLETFRSQPDRAYAYAITDSILTLLVQERMEVTHRGMYTALGFREDDIPALRSTLGSRVAELVVRSITRDAAGSNVLSNRKAQRMAGGSAVPASAAKVRTLLHKGAAGFITEEHLSQFGEQTGQTHGGLCFSRSPTRFFHSARGMLADVDLSSCYAQVMGSMRLYAGRPIVHEPGSGGMSLKDAVAFARDHAAGPDAWVIRVSGKIAAGPNVLIPSTKGALTNTNYKSRTAKRRAAAQWTRAARQRFAFDRLDEGKKDTANTAIFTSVIEAGVVAWPTWLMIRALPEAWRQEYEKLEVDTVLFYPAKLVAHSAAEFDRLVEKFRNSDTPWSATIEMGEPDQPIRQVIEWRTDEDHVALRFNLGELATALQQRRLEARKVHGEGTAAEKGWKEAANSLYGVVASKYLPTNNVVAANVITATARALAFTMQLSLNGFQVVTDGCTYRRDQIPAGTLADCLTACPDYPINRADFGGPFVDPARIPTEDTAFTAWYREHVKRFFGVDDPDYDRLFGLHALAHKEVGDPKCANFDALCCDGSANYVKLKWADDENNRWKLAGELKDSFKARSFGAGAKEALFDWIVRVYPADAYDHPPPVTESRNPLAYKEAGQVARAALKLIDAQRAQSWLKGPLAPTVVYFPLGLERRLVKVYKAIKRSGFLFQTPKQETAWARAMDKFAETTSCGLEVLAQRRNCEGRRQGSITDVATAIYRMIRSGG